MKYFAATFFMTVGLLIGCGERPQTDETSSVAIIEQAYVRAPIPSSTTATGYLTLTNNGQTELELVSVTSRWASAVEIHEHQHDNGTMRMRRLPTLTVAPGDSVEFKPGAKHLMLFGFDTSDADAAAATVDELTFRFKSGESVTVQAAVKSLL